MVTVFLRGGLGNQMFQYATGLSLAKKQETEVVFDTVFLNDRFPRKDFAYRTYDLDIFTLDQHFTSLSKISAKFPIPGVWLGLDLSLSKVWDILGTQKILREKDDYLFDVSILEAGPDVLLWGRWQNEKYFKDIESDVRAAFRFRNPLNAEAVAIAKEIEATNSVSLHIRRGDYAAFKTTQKLWGGTDLDYYHRAAKHIAAQIEHPQFYIFSDDIAWSRENLKLEYPMTFVPASAAGAKGECHLELMSLCKYHIITNSTFSWWGAWLDPRPDKTVIAPKQWQASPKVMSTELVPADWILL